MRAFEIILKEDSVTYMIYVDEKPAAKYQNLYDLERDLSLIKSKFPNKKFTVRKETCKTTRVGSGLIG